MADAARRGRRVRVIVSPDLKGWTRRSPWPALGAAGVEVRVFPMPARITVADVEVGLMIPPAQREDRLNALWIPIRDVLVMLRPSLEAMWEQGKPVP